LANKRLGAADANQEAMLNGIVDLNRLERIFERLDQVSSWAELIATP
jgi:hypothetical protein